MRLDHAVYRGTCARWLGPIRSILASTALAVSFPANADYLPPQDSSQAAQPTMPSEASETGHSDDCLREALQRVSGIVLSSETDWPRAKPSSPLAEASTVLADMARSPDPETRLNALEGLAQTGTAEQGEMIRLAFRDPDPLVRARAIKCLKSFEAKELRESVLGVLLNPGDTGALFMDETLSELRAQLEDGMLDVLNSADETASRQSAAAYCLGQMRSGKATVGLAQTALASGGETAVICANAIMAISDPAALPYLGQMAGHGEAGVRWAAVQTLGKIGGPESLAILSTVVQDTWQADTNLKREAIGMMGRMGDDSAIPALITCMNRFPAVQANAIAALESITGLGFGHSPMKWTEWFQKRQQELSGQSSKTPIIIEGATGPAE